MTRRRSSIDTPRGPTIAALPAAGPASSGGCRLGCGAVERGLDDGFGGGNRPDVTVVHQGTVRPYETVMLHAEVASPDWLTSRGFAIDLP